MWNSCRCACKHGSSASQGRRLDQGISQERADVRLIGTTGGDLKSAMLSGQMRSDLYYLSA